MRHRRTRITIAVVAVVLLLLAGAIYLRATAPPEVARLLPESDGIIYLNLQPLRAATHFDRTQVPHSAAYQKFINATGIVFERDLNEAAFALERMPDPNGPNGPVAYSEVFEGHFDGGRLKNYLASIADAKESYAGHTIYDIRNDGRTDRVALLGYDMVAVSNTPTPEQIHSIVDRYRTAALPFTGSSLLAAHYHDVPLLSLAWGIGKIGLPFGGSGQKEISVAGMSLPISADATLIASVRWTGALKLRVEEIAGSVADATATTQQLQSMLGLLHAAEGTPPGEQMDPNLKAVLNSAKVRQKKDRVVLTASVPNALVKAALTPVTTPAAAGTEPVSPAPAAPPAKAKPDAKAGAQKKP
ncbi:MAG: hypothetical protein ACP5M4_05190 [Acidobacteriaceae bacterium]